MFHERPLSRKHQHQEFFFRFFNDPIKFTSDNIATYNIAFIMRRNSIYYKNFREVIQRLFEAGILEQIPGISMFAKSTRGSSGFDAFEMHFKKYERKKDQVVLSLDYLHAGFLVWVGAVIVSIIVFVGELIVSAINERM